MKIEWGSFLSDEPYHFNFQKYTNLKFIFLPSDSFFFTFSFSSDVSQTSSNAYFLLQVPQLLSYFCFVFSLFLLFSSLRLSLGLSSTVSLQTDWLPHSALLSFRDRKCVVSWYGGIAFSVNHINVTHNSVLQETVTDLFNISLFKSRVNWKFFSCSIFGGWRMENKG